MLTHRPITASKTNRADDNDFHRGNQAKLRTYYNIDLDPILISTPNNDYKKIMSMCVNCANYLLVIITPIQFSIHCRYELITSKVAGFSNALAARWGNKVVSRRADKRKWEFSCKCIYKTEIIPEITSSRLI